jgi:hypothetical protein
MLNGGGPKLRNLRLAARSGFSVWLVERSLIPLNSHYPAERFTLRRSSGFLSRSLN